MTSKVGNVPLDADPLVWAFVHYWQRIRPSGRLPGRAHLDPIEIPKLLPNIRLLDVLDDGPFRYRVRLIGTECVHHLGYDPTGSWYENITSAFRGSIVERDLKQVCTTRRPVYRRGRTLVPYVTEATQIERVHLPFAKDGHNVDLIASLTLFDREKPRFDNLTSSTANADGDRGRIAASA
ncbi:MAG: PAS domain-containing protein [Acidiferrobacterales bacterium]|nr:PAS domain-containing protein [Acidiferrobacterales bacterium]